MVNILKILNQLLDKIVICYGYSGKLQKNQHDRFDVDGQVEFFESDVLEIKINKDSITIIIDDGE